ncbi:hypothetical protein SAMN05216227_102063 [Pseudorhodobacter antarcticus]|uniref:Uncharacterized protein n=1 Tax=Pseudorhodobacter antarcticus TaxID=1077947 RepID=A0A1H8IJY9_9RHOB|nr:hypothetical protein SAMN05216227_102063 [Pseudorhodobacter antarcticus]
MNIFTVLFQAVANSEPRMIQLRHPMANQPTMKRPSGKRVRAFKLFKGHRP